jgi:hypothetical protein
LRIEQESETWNSCCLSIAVSNDRTTTRHR